MVPARPGFIGKLGWVRSSAWDLALLVDREYDGILGRIDIETDDVLQLLGKRWTVRQFERADAMWRQLVGFKDALHRAEAHSLILLNQKVAADGEAAMRRLEWVCRDQTMVKRGFRAMWRRSRA
jgi:hypothetical protein